jgi:dUTP pyrophosphatase
METPTYKRLNFVNKSPNENPTFADPGSSGIDLRAWISEEEAGVIILKPLERKLIHTGIYFDIPRGCEIQIRPRSGLAIKKGLTVINTPATIDESYTGECCVLLVNLSNEEILIYNNDRIAQAVLCPVYNGYKTDLIQISEITKETERGDKGFGHTGVK